MTDLYRIELVRGRFAFVRVGAARGAWAHVFKDELVVPDHLDAFSSISLYSSSIFLTIASLTSSIISTGSLAAA